MRELLDQSTSGQSRAGDFPRHWPSAFSSAASGSSRFSLGIVVGTLLAGVLIGQLDIKVPALVKTIFFDLFLFTTGYKVGPQFFRGLKSDALSQLALTLVVCVTCLLTAYGSPQSCLTTTPARPRGCLPALFRNPPSSARPAMRSIG